MLFLFLHLTYIDLIFCHMNQTALSDKYIFHYKLLQWFYRDIGAIKNATSLLKAGGSLAIADFFLSGNFDDCLPPLSRRIRVAESLFHKVGTDWREFDVDFSFSSSCRHQFMKTILLCTFSHTTSQEILSIFNYFCDTIIQRPGLQWTMFTYWVKSNWIWSLTTS